MTATNASDIPPFKRGTEVPRALIEFILRGNGDDSRFLQDSPLFGEVWVEFGIKIGERLDLLITPYKDQVAGTLASVLTGDRRIVDGEVLDSYEELSYPHELSGDAQIAFLQGIVAARLTFEEVVRHLVPLTSWWRDKRALQYFTSEVISDRIHDTLNAARAWFIEGRPNQGYWRSDALSCFITLTGLILWAELERADQPDIAGTTADRIRRLLDRAKPESIVSAVTSVLDTLAASPSQPLVSSVGLNRRATAAMTRSISAVKADAARRVFWVDCRNIVWAVLDSGIDAQHSAFRDNRGTSRVKKTFDFTRIRNVVTLDNLRPSPRRDTRVSELLSSPLKQRIAEADASERLRRIASSAKEGRSINWELVEPFLEIDPARSLPGSDHGTHVAGIIGAARGPIARVGPDEYQSDSADGMCPEINLYDFRVLASSLTDTEFAIIAALQYIRYINDRNVYRTIHGANLSLSVPHDVRNYACGQTPICNECERLVNSGVVVVAAAGNRGYQSFETTEGIPFENYAALSVTDPGNAEAVITVGSTHRFSPHIHGVSFFSSRGPTGDGRMKPDLLAPGERIRGPLPFNDWGDLDGTSMAAAHVSGAAALLMAHHADLVGQPRRVKEILCRTATDLGRAKTFQGHGMLDVLRALQSI